MKENISDSQIIGARVTKIPLDLECMLDIQNGKGIRLTSVESFNKKNEKIYEGLQSEFFGSDFADNEAFKERYRCKCGKYIGSAYKGFVCEVCHHPVEYNDIDLNRFGWIILDHFVVISPIYYAKLADALGKFEGEYILNKIIAMGYHDEDELLDFNEKDLATLKKHPYIKRGMRWLVENIDEVLDYYDKKKPSKAKLFAELRREKDLMFTHSIPVYSSILRTELPNGEKGSKSFKLKVNTHYKAIIKLVNAINKVPKEEFDHHKLNTIDIELAAIQKEIAGLFEETVKDLTSKAGIVNSKVLGGRYNFSSRNIIVPNSGRLRSDEVEIGYVPFLELYRYEIINFYKKLKGCTISQASNAWKNATNHFDPTIYAIMKHMVTDKKYKDYMYIILNRNPSINYGSFVAVRIVGVKSNLSDKTLTLSSQIIVPMNADFDGDVLNVYRLIGADFGRRFAKNMNPRFNLFISRMTGKANKEVLPIKDEIISFWAFNNI